MKLGLRLGGDLIDCSCCSIVGSLLRLYSPLRMKLSRFLSRDLQDIIGN